MTLLGPVTEAQNLHAYIERLAKKTEADLALAERWAANACGDHKAHYFGQACALRSQLGELKEAP